MPTVDDDKREQDGSVTVTLNASPDYTLSASSSATVARMDNERTPQLKVEADAGEVNEGSPASFTVTTIPTGRLTMTVNYQVIHYGGYVAAGDLGTQSLTFTGPSATIAVPTIHDNVAEPDGSLTVMLLPDKSYRMGVPSVATTTVKNTDTIKEVPRLSVSAPASSHFEGRPVRFIVQANRAPSGSLTVDYQVIESGGYVSSRDLGRKQITLTGSSATIIVPTISDNEAEPSGDGSALVALLPGRGYALQRQNVAQTTILNDDPLRPSITVSGGPGITEGEDAEYVFSASPAPQNSLTIHYTVSQDSDKVVDGQAVSKTLTLTGSRATVTVPTLDDNAGEPDDHVSVTVNDGSGYSVGSPASASVLVHDNDSYPTVTLSGAPANVDEGNSFDLIFHISETLPLHQHGLSVKYRINDRGHARTRNAFIPRQVTQTTVSITPKDDNSHHPDGPLSVTVLSGENYRVGSPSSVTVNVREDDPAGGPPTISLSGPASVTEGDPMVYTVTASSAPQGGSVPVHYRVGRSYDYGKRVASNQLGRKSVSLTGTTATITVPTIDDDIYDGPAAFTVGLRDVSGYRVVQRTVGTQVVDDDPNPTITVETIPDSNNPAVAEGNPARFTIAANPAPAGDLTINYRVYQEGDFVDGSYLGNYSVTLTNSAPSATVSVPTLDDNVEEPRGRVEIYIAYGRGYTYEIYPDGYAVYYVDDNDQRGNPTISVTGPTEVTEGSAVAYTITSSPAPKGSLTVNYRISQEGGFVAAGELGLKSVTITSATTTVSIPTLGDDVDEEDGSVSLTLGSGTTYRLDPTDYYATTTVEDDDVANPDLRIISRKSSVDEGDTAQFTLFIEPPAAGGLTVKYRVSQSGDFVAAAGLGDKELETTSPIVFISLPTVNDDTDEADGSVTVTLLTSTDYNIVSGRSSATISVADDD